MVGLLARGVLAKVSLVASSRLWVAMWFVYGFFGLFSARLLVRHQIRRWQHVGRLARNVAIVGAGPHGKRLIEHMVKHGDKAERIVGVYSDDMRQVSGDGSVGGYNVIDGRIDIDGDGNTVTPDTDDNGPVLPYGVTSTGPGGI